MADATPQRDYEQRRDRARAEAARADGWSAVAGNGRVLLAIAAVATFLIVHLRQAPQPLAAYGALAILAIASLLVQGRADRHRNRARVRVLHYEHALARLAGGWRSFSSRGERFDRADHPYGRDLDVLGQGSLFQLLDTTRTARGEATLAGWLLNPSTLAAAAARRTAAQALQPEMDARERLALAGLDQDLSRIDEAPLIEWASGPVLFDPSRPFIWAARLLPLPTIAAAILWRTGTLPIWPALVLLAVHALFIRSSRQAIAKLGGIAERSEAMLLRLLDLFEAACTLPTDAPPLAALVASLQDAVAATGSLRRRVSAFQSRQNLILAVLSPFVLWDIHTALLLQSWWAQWHGKVEGWLEALGAIEGLSAIATFACEHPDHVWPELADGPAAFEADALGHPLLEPDRCVRNDVALVGAGTALLVTGSNMSGKSTLLRAVGLNVVLALAGLPVRAARLRVSRVRPATVMRVSDSLQEGASFFLAELLRLKGVVDLANAGEPVLFLLDEILQGTNSRERSLGARGVIAHLLDSGAFGLVSTHDLTLVQLGDHFRDRVRYAHFTDQVENGRMTFDYRLRPGVVQTTNALRLMQSIGLRVEIPPE